MSNVSKEYNGWTLYKNVTLVIKNETGGENYKQAYVVNTKDKKQLQSAEKWGTTYKTKPTIISTENKNFKITLLESAKDSCQGGKLSFWDCLIEKEELNLKVVVGINSELLLNVLLQNTFKNGKCNEKFKFARCQGGVGLLSENMKEYKEALRDMKTKSDISKGKTTKWKLGHSYETLTMNNLYLGEIYRPFEVETEEEDYYTFRGNKRKIIFKKNNNQKRYASYDLRYFDKEDTYRTKSIDNLLESFMKNAIDSMSSASSHSNIVYYYKSLLENDKKYVFEKLPSRQEGNLVMNLNCSNEKEYKEKIHKHLTLVKELILKDITNGKSLKEEDIASIFVDVYKRDINSVTNTEMKLLKLMTDENYLKMLYREEDTFTIYTEIDGVRTPGLHLDKLLS